MVSLDHGHWFRDEHIYKFGQSALAKDKKFCQNFWEKGHFLPTDVTRNASLEMLLILSLLGRHCLRRKLHIGKVEHTGMEGWRDAVSVSLQDVPY